MSLNISYYFKRLEKFPLPELFSEISRVDEILSGAKTILMNMLVTPDIRMNAGIMKSEDIHLYGNYSIGEGTVIYNGVTIIGPVYIGKRVIKLF